MARTNRSTDHLLSSRTDMTRESYVRFFEKAERGHIPTPRCGVGTVAGSRVALDTHDEVDGDTAWARRATNKAIRREARRVIREFE